MVGSVWWKTSIWGGVRTIWENITCSRKIRSHFECRFNRELVICEIFQLRWTIKNKNKSYLRLGPKILLLSGIGPAQHLKEIGIPLLVDAPGVGENLQDHVGTMLGPFLISQPLSYLPVRDINVDSGDEFLTNGTGPLSLSFAHGVAIFPSSKAEFAVYPDIQVKLWQGSLLLLSLKFEFNCVMPPGWSKFPRNQFLHSGHPVKNL